MKIDELAFIRNSLVNNEYNNEIKQLINQVKIDISSKENNRFYFLLHMLELAEEEINKRNYKEASYDVNLIHNFPKNINDIWNEEYFYKFDFVGYYDYLIENKNISKLKIVIALINRYLI